MNKLALLKKLFQKSDIEDQWPKGKITMPPDAPSGEFERATYHSRAPSAGASDVQKARGDLRKKKFKADAEDTEMEKAEQAEKFAKLLALLGAGAGINELLEEDE